MGSLVLTGDTSGSGTITVPAVAGTFTATIGSATGTHYPFTAGTAVASTSGTSIDFTSIPSWVKRITVMLSGVSTSGSSILTLRAGTSGGIVSSGYTGSIFYASTTGNFSVDSTGVALTTSNLTAAASTYRGSIILSLLGSNTWVAQGTLNYTTSGGTAGWLAYEVTLGGTLDRVRVTTLNGTDTFDAGSINILYE